MPYLIFAGKVKSLPLELSPIRSLKIEYLSLGPYSQCFIFLETNKWVYEARAFLLGKPFQFSIMQHYSLFGPLISHKVNEVLWIGPLVVMLQLILLAMCLQGPRLWNFLHLWFTPHCSKLERWSLTHTSNNSNLFY